MLALLVALGLAAAITAWGRVWRSADQAPVRQLAYTLGCGLLLTSWLTCVLGWLGLWNRVWLGLVVGLPLLWRPRQILALWSRAQAELRGELAPWTRLCLGVVLGLALVAGLAPNTHFDVEVYHYTLPRLYLERGGLYWTGSFVFDGFFQQSHMLYVLALGLGGEAAAGLLGGLFLAWLGLLTVSIVSRFQPGAAGSVLVVILTSPVVLLQSSGGLTDLPAAALAMWALDAWLGHCYGICALACGAAVATKLSAAPAVAALVLASLLRGHRRGAAGIVLATVLVCAPWWGRNLYHTGTPLYPLGGDWSPRRVRSLEVGVGKLLPRRFPLSLLLPDFSAGDGRRWQQAFNPALWAGCLLTGPGAGWTWLPTGVYLIGVLPLHLADQRYLLPGLLWLGVISGLRIHGWLARSRWVRLALAASAGTGLAFTTAWVLPRVPVALGWESPDHFLERHSPLTEAYRYLGLHHAGERILLLDRRGYRCPLPFVLGDHGMPPLALKNLTGLAAEPAAEKLARAGIHLILWNLHLPGQARAWQAPEGWSGPYSGLVRFCRQGRRVYDQQGILIVESGNG